MTTTPGEDQLVAQIALFREWRSQIEAGALTEVGLMALRARLDETSNEFIPGLSCCASLELMRLDAADALAAMIGCRPEDLPGADPVPDDLADLDE